MVQPLTVVRIKPASPDAKTWWQVWDDAMRLLAEFDDLDTAVRWCVKRGVNPEVLLD